MSAPSRKSGLDAGVFILWIFAGYFFLGLPGRVPGRLGLAAFGDETLAAFAPSSSGRWNKGPLGEAWADLIMEIHRFGQSLQPR